MATVSTFGTPSARTFGELFGPIASNPHPFGDFGLLGAALPATDYTSTLILGNGSTTTTFAASGIATAIVVNDGSTTTEES